MKHPTWSKPDTWSKPSYLSGETTSNLFQDNFRFELTEEQRRKHYLDIKSKWKMSGNT